MHKPRLLPARQSFKDVWSTLQFQPCVLCMQARVPIGTVRSMINGYAVPRADAERVLCKMTELFEGDYTLETISVAAKEETSWT